MITISHYKNKQVAVFGLGKAGMSAVKALHASGARVLAWDDSEKAQAALLALKLAGVSVARPETYDWNAVDVLVLSPGVPLTHPVPHPVVKLAQGKCPIICDVELLYQANTGAGFIGITGTNGKSTTTALIAHILKEAGVPCEVGGNLGIPALDLEVLSEGYYVLEMSSYQLDLLEQMRFDIALWLNISPDHLDRHGGIDGYVAAKKHIFDRQTSDDYIVIGVDDSRSVEVYGHLQKERRKVTPISNRRKTSGGVAVMDSVIYDDMDSTAGEIKLGELKHLCGSHNAQNIAAAFAVVKRAGVDEAVIVKAVRSFKGLRHRMQYVKQIDGVAYINDSKATNAEAASKALASYDNIYWIAGGMPKAGGITSLKEFFPRIKHAFLMGQAQDEFAQTLEGLVKFSKCDTLETAFQKAQQYAVEDKNSPVVLLSPACASFDQWPNFEVRGDAFCAMVGEG